MLFAVVDPAGGVVSNVVVGDDLETVQSVVGPCVLVTEESGPAAPGYTWDGITFTDPPEPQTETAPSGTMTPELEAALIDAGWTPPEA
jgi:hypothetical protein